MSNEKNTRSILIDTHEPILRLAAGGLLVLSSLAAICSWIFGSDNIEAPLLLAGVSVIALGVILTKAPSAVMLATLIVGYLVVPEDYLLRIAHMVTGSTAKLEDYTRQSEESNPDEFVNALLKAVEPGQSSSLASTRTRLSEALGSEMARRVRREGATTPLRQIVRGDSESLFREFGLTEFFVDDMEFLRSQGLVTFFRREFDTAEPTSLGIQVAEILEEGDFGVLDDSLRLSGSERLDMFQVVPTDRIATLEEISFGDNGPFTFELTRASWHRLNVPVTRRYEINIESFSGDPLAGLYDGHGNLLDQNDDGGSGLDSRLAVRLERGEYLLGIVNLWSEVVEYSIKLHGADN